MTRRVAGAAGGSGDVGFPGRGEAVLDEPFGDAPVVVAEQESARGAPHGGGAGVDAVLEVAGGAGGAANVAGVREAVPGVQELGASVQLVGGLPIASSGFGFQGVRRDSGVARFAVAASVALVRRKGAGVGLVFQAGFCGAFAAAPPTHSIHAGGMCGGWP